MYEYAAVSPLPHAFLWPGATFSSKSEAGGIFFVTSTPEIYPRYFVQYGVALSLFCIILQIRTFQVEEPVIPASENLSVSERITTDAKCAHNSSWFNPVIPVSRTKSVHERKYNIVTGFRIIAT
jgi:hypothetical protein